jgi:hypothetical protein
MALVSAVLERDVVDHVSRFPAQSVAGSRGRRATRSWSLPVGRYRLTTSGAPPAGPAPAHRRRRVWRGLGEAPPIMTEATAADTPTRSGSSRHSRAGAATQAAARARFRPWTISPRDGNGSTTIELCCTQRSGREPQDGRLRDLPRQNAGATMTHEHRVA